MPLEQRQELKERLALELYIKNFSTDDFLAFFEDASQEELTRLATILSEAKGSKVTEMAMAKYSHIVDQMTQTDINPLHQYFIQASQIFVDFGTQHHLVYKTEL